MKEEYQNEITKSLGITIEKQKENAKTLGISLSDFQNKMMPSYEIMAKALEANNDPNHDPYEGWTREEIRHFEDKFHKQPLVGTFTDAPITTTAEIDAEFEQAFKGKTFEELFDD